MTLSPGADGRSSGLFTPSNRALAGRVGRNNGDIASPARLYMADRREEDDDAVVSLSLTVADSDEAKEGDDGSSSVDGELIGAKACAETPKRAADTSLNNAMVGLGRKR